MDKIQLLLDKFDKSQGVSINTRTLRYGQLYFALKGENFNGNLFAKEALEKGAVAAVVDEAAVCEDQRFILVEDVLNALQDLARAHRRRFDIPIVAITGTNGKTTTKELLTNIISQKYTVHATSGNQNNHIGVPLTLLALKKNHQFIILEMGASNEGEIRDLCIIAEPTAGLITNIGKAHIEGFGDQETIARTKSELYDFLHQNDRTIFMSKDLKQHDHFSAISYNNIEMFSADSMAGKTIESLVLYGNDPGVVIQIKGLDDKTYKAHSNLFGDYNFSNLISVLKMADHFGLNIQECIEGIESYFPSNNRSQINSDERGNLIVMDAYNANPSSVHAALDYFLRINSEKNKIVILGDMLELGNISLEEHLKVIRKIYDFSIITFMLVGNEFQQARQTMDEEILPPHVFFFENTLLAKLKWESMQIENSMVLVKGSRGIALEKLFD